MEQQDNQDANVAFILVARNERARKMWAKRHNSSRWGHFSQGPTTLQEKPGGPLSTELAEKLPDEPKAENNDQRLEPKRKTKAEPALRFQFSEKPKDYTNGFLLGSDPQSCDVLLGSSDTGINPQMLAFTFNTKHELIMNDKSIQTTTVQFNDQLPAKRNRYCWILPPGQNLIRVTVGEDLKCDLVFDVVVPTRGEGSMAHYHENCKPFVIRGAGERLIAESFFVGSTAAKGQGTGASKPASPFYLRGKEVGHGSFGRVSKTLRMPDGKLFAMKAPILPEFWEDNFAAKKKKIEENFKQEIDMLKLVSTPNHDNIVQFVDEWDGDHTKSIILDFVPGGTLQKRLAQVPPVLMELPEVLNISYQILNALEFVHDKGIVHQDVKPGNILRKSQDHYMLADFGSAGLIPTLGGRGTRKYMAPESDRSKPYGCEADVWSVGVVILACLDGLPTGDGKSRPEWCEKVRQKILDYDSLYKRHADKKPEIRKQAYQLIHMLRGYMLQLDPSGRMSAKELLENFQSLWKQGVPRMSSRIEEVEDFGVMTPPSVGREYNPALENFDQGSHSDPPARKAAAIEAPTISSLTKPEGEANAPSLPSVGEKRKRGDRSSAADDGEKEATAPGRRPTADLKSPANKTPPHRRLDLPHPKK